MTFFKYKSIKLTSTVVLALTASTQVFSNEGASSVVLSKNHRIYGGVSLYVSPNGQDFFIHNLDDLIYRASDFATKKPIDISHYQKDSYNYKMPEALDLDHLPAKLQKHSATIEKIRASLREWLTGFDIKNPRLSVTAQNIDFTAEWKRLSIFSDFSAAKDFGADMSQGPVIVLEAEIPHIQLGVQKVEADDLSNADLRGFEIRKPKLTLLKDKTLNIRIAVQMLRKNEEFSVHVLSVKTNLENTKWDFSYTKPIKLPQLIISINDHPMTLNTKPVEAMIDENEKGILNALVSSIDHFAENTLPGMIEEQVDSHVKTGLDEMVTSIAAVGAPTAEPGSLMAASTWNELTRQLPGFDSHQEATSPFTIGVGLGGFQNYSPEYRKTEKKIDFLGIDLDVFAEDPTHLNYDEKLEKNKTIRRRAFLEDVDPNSFDFALTVNENVVNQVLQLSFNRGYFNDQKTDTGLLYSMLKAPVLHFENGQSDGKMTNYKAYLASTSPNSHMRPYARTHVRLRSNPDLTFTQSIGLIAPCEIELDVFMSLEINEKGELSLIQTGFDENSVQVDDAYVHFYPFLTKDYMRKKVKAGVADFLRPGFVNPKVFMQKPIPSELMGIPFKIVSFRTEESGNAVVYIKLDREHLKVPKNK